MSEVGASKFSPDRQTQEQLAALRAEWGHAYWIWFELGLFCACRKDNEAICRRPTPETLRTELHADATALPRYPGPPSSPAHFLQARFPSYRIGLDQGTLAWVATVRLSETARGFWYGPGLPELALKLGAEGYEAG